MGVAVRQAGMTDRVQRQEQIHAEAPPGRPVTLPRLAAVLAGGIGLLALLGWASGLAPLASFLPGGIAVRPWTALGLVLGGASLILAEGSGRAAGRGALACAAGLGAIAGAALLQYATGTDFGTDTLLFPDALRAAAPQPVAHPGRVAGATAASMAALSLALGLAVLWRGRMARGGALLLGVAGLAPPALALIGQLVAIDPLAGMTLGHRMALPTAIALSALALGVIARSAAATGTAAPRLAMLLLGLVLAALLPAVAVGLGAVWQAAEGRRASAAEALRDGVRGLAIALDAEIASQIRTLALLAASPAFDAGAAAEPGPAHALLARARGELGVPLALLSPDGRLLQHSDMPPGAPPQPLDRADDLRRAVESGAPLVIGLGPTSAAEGPVAGLVVPVLRGGAVVAALGMRLEPEAFRRLLAAQRLEEGAFAALTDDAHRIVARSDARHAEMLGRRIPPDRDRLLAAGEEGEYRAESLDGVERSFAFRRLRSAPGWTLVVGQPVAVLDRAAAEPVAAVLRGGAFAALLGAALALLLAWRILRPLRRLEAHARRVAAGGGEEPGQSDISRPGAIAELETLRSGFAAAEAALRARAAALAESEERFRLAALTGQGIIYDFDPVANHAVRLGAVERMLGYRPEEIAPTREAWFALVHPEDLATYRAAAGTVFRGSADRFEVEYRLLHRDGHEVHVWHRVLAMRDPGGRVVRAIGNILDISSRRRAEAALAESEGRFRTMADGAPVPLWVNGPDGGCRFVNAAYLRFFGKTAEEVLAFGWTPAVHPEDGEGYVTAYLAAVAARAPFEAEARFLNAAGEYRRTRSRGMPRLGPGGEYLGHVGITIDLHDQLAAEAALAEREARLRLATEGAGVGIWRVDLLTGTGSWSGEAMELFGIGRATFSVADWLEAIHPADRAMVSEAWRRTVEEGASYEIEFRSAAPAPDGGERWLLSRGRVELDARTGRAVTGAGVLLDVTDRVRAEALLRLHREELERLVEARTAALQRETEERRRAEEAARQGEQLAALGRLTGGVAHDFNNLLQVVTSGAALLRRDPPEARRNRVLDAMVEAGAKARDLTSRLLAFARRQPLRPEVLDLNARIGAMTELLRRTLGSRIRVETEFAEALPPVLADPGQLEIALINLATNARDAMPAGGRLVLRTRLATVPAVAERVAGDYVLLEVEDCGEGMSPAVQARIFEPFFTTKESGKGTGLGLAQVFGFARQSGGDVVVESEPGRGTRVAILLRPAEAGAAGAPSPAGGAVIDAMRSSAGQVVLVVEDNLEAGDFAAALLEELGYRTRRAGDVAGALSVLAEGGRIDAVFSDVVMPGGETGLDLALRLRAERPGVAVVLTSGYSARLAEGGGPEGVEVLAKPYRLDELAAALARALARVPEEVGVR